jgi:SAM-dependent methyltransferase
MFNWKKDISEVSIDVILLFEDHHLRYMKDTDLQKEFVHIFKSKPYIEWFIRNKVPELNTWIDEISLKYSGENISSIDELREIELKVICQFEDWIIYILSPNDYGNQPFNNWDENELLDITDWGNKIVVDIGSGTGKQAFTVAPYAKTVYCIEPVLNLRKYLKGKAIKLNYKNIYTMDGLITSIPFENEFADIVMCGHVLGDSLREELKEMERITKMNGIIIACPGNIDKDNEQHKQLIEEGYKWERFLEPGDVIGSGHKRKYWKSKIK